MSYGYKVLNKQEFNQGNYSLVPIRSEDRYEIMKWRNEQIYHLRQSHLLTKEDQDRYFDRVVKDLYGMDQPDQVLFSYLEGTKCIGYGGLVHINWIDKNAEISFIMDTQREQMEFHKHWGIYLDLLSPIAFGELKLHKIYTYAFDLRPHLYEAIEAKGFTKEAVLIEHCLFDGEYKDVIIHSKINDDLVLRKMRADDKNQTFEWANDTLSRVNSYNTDPIPYEVHSNWFDKKLVDTNALYYIGELGGIAVGLIRFDTKEDKLIIGITIDNRYRGQRLSSKLIKKACRLITQQTDFPIVAYIKKENAPSIKSFKKAGFVYQSDLKINNIESYEYIFKK